MINVSATYGSNYPAGSYSAGDVFLMEGSLLTLANSCQRHPRHRVRAQNIGIFGAIGVGGFIALPG